MRMIPIFLGLAAAAIAVCAAAFAGGLSIGSAPVAERAAAVVAHQLLGLSASVLLLVAQCAVFVYFLGTGKAIKTSVETRGLDPELALATRRLKGKTFPFATFSALAAVAGAVLSGAASPATHAAAMAVAVGLTLLAIPFELKSIRENTQLMARTGEDLERAEQRIVSSGGSVADPDAAPGVFVAGRLLLVIAASTWLVFAYRSIVMRAQPQPWPWYLTISAASLAAGVPLALAGLRSRRDGGRETKE